MSHQLVVLFHLLCAILFVGAVAMEVLILEPVRRKIGEESFQAIEFYLFRQIRRTYPVAILVLYATGFYMYLGFVESFGGFKPFIQTNLGLLLTVKLALALGLLSVFAFSPFLFMQPKKRTFLDRLKHFTIVTGGPQEFRIDRFEAIHYLALALGVCIVVLAKIMCLF